MSIAPREAKCLRSWNCWPGQPARFGQRVKTAPSSLTVGVSHDGQRSGGRGGAARSLRSTACGAGESTCGITSPARRTMTSSPTRRSLRAMSSSLWSVASFTVTPPTWTGSRTANGWRSPNLPTFHAMSSSSVTAVVGGNFHAIAQRGSRPTTPSRRCSSMSSTLTTHAVDLEVERAAALLPRLALGDDLVLGVEAPDVAVDPEVVRAQPLERVPVASRTRCPRSPRRRSTTSRAGARRRASGRAGGSCRRPRCAGS